MKEKNRLEAWLTFLGGEDAETIMELLRDYPEFLPLYKEVYEMCRNMEDFMRLFSKELEILDSNTVQYMIDEMQERIDEQSKQLDKQSEQLNEKDKEIEQLKKRLAEVMMK